MKMYVLTMVHRLIQGWPYAAAGCYFCGPRTIIERDD